MNQFYWWIIEDKTPFELLDIFESHKESRPWVQYFMNELPMYPGKLDSVCRIGYVPFSHCKQNRFYYLDKSREIETLAAGGICSEIYWDGEAESLPEGWQGSVRQAYFDSKDGSVKRNTVVGLLAFTLSRYRKRGFSGKIINKMCSHGQLKGYDYCIIPTLPPTQFEQAFVDRSIEEIARLKREDDNYYDYWLRLHTRKGAKIIGTSNQSHRFALSLKDFAKYVSSDKIIASGEQIVRLNMDKSLGRNGQNMWQNVYADIERDLVTFNWGCIWVKYDLKELNFV